MPVRAALLVAAFAALPLLGLAGRLGEQARSSVLHVAITFAVLMLAFRLIGKRELGSMSPFELVTLMLIPEILSNSVQGQGSLATSLSGLCMILLLVLGSSLLSQRFPPVQRLLESSPTLLVADGQLIEDALNRERIAPEELFAEMRRQSIAELSDIRFAVLEVSGRISFVPQDRQS
jgi:uncharacterized membrane protein YcaP (DUF421 family)